MSHTHAASSPQPVRLKEQTNFSLPADVRAIIDSVASDLFDGNRSAALRYVVRDWNKLKFIQQNPMTNPSP
jgi:hypothetical protein